jgi:hypothetical protein
MRLTYNTLAEAQAVADRIHTSMIATVPDYAASVNAGHTLAWAVPGQDRDLTGVLLSANWYVAVNDRCMACLSAAEVLAIIA